MLVAELFEFQFDEDVALEDAAAEQEINESMNNDLSSYEARQGWPGASHVICERESKIFRYFCPNGLGGASFNFALS